ncbi:serine hydrolase [Aureliella helgolandensis]|uniref:D-alanyl-D-alanine carboxypeptidase DacC n=1 Tax=Aureliella helgolandensis TaxID=2527968 RepID=A0A518GCE6_9BACT|nr:serine hydrolase [Aureliella helgolandensis]QDV26243.1 D-alanyl-D-alanine carboxypeptidase DacC precursor [Aureliella helgolandensis]
MHTSPDSRTLELIDEHLFEAYPMHDPTPRPKPREIAPRRVATTQIATSVVLPCCTWRSLHVCCLSMIWALGLFGGVPTFGQTQSDLAAALQPLVDAHAGDVAVAAAILDSDLKTRISWNYQGDQVMPTASLIKLPVMIEAYRQAQAGGLSLEHLIVLREEDKVPGSGILTEQFSAGTSLPLNDAIRLMMRYSDNTATNLVLDSIGLESTAKTMAELGFPETRIHSKVFRRDTSIDSDRSQKYGLGSTTANETVTLLSQLVRGELADESSTQSMLDHLFACEATNGFPRDLPAGTRVAHKTGSVTLARTEAGIIDSPAGKIVLCVLTNNNEDKRWSENNAGNVLCAKLAKAAFDLVNPEPADTSESFPQQLSEGSTGELVEALQRTLNARIQSDLGIDGDFGPATAAAVKKFQTSAKLSNSGVVDAQTWQALGEILMVPEPVAAPELINSEKLAVAPPLDPLAPPQVTAKAFAILDLATGEVLAELNGDEPLPNASTTKLLTAYVVLDYAQSHPEVLQETVTFSERADQTLGSTSGVKAGEQLPVYELLYGLMLPSGNDASVALAEHFGGRLANPSQPEANAEEAYDAFIAAMNAKAQTLHMTHTHFANPHGLPAEKHHSSAIDLAKLAKAALKLPEMRKYVTCRQRGCQVTSLNGYSRNILWKNTNRLLGQAGFTGLKTGTTSAAGACLVASGVREEQARVVVVLGAVSSDARYVDARNLFAWSWRDTAR